MLANENGSRPSAEAIDWRPLSALDATLVVEDEADFRNAAEIDWRPISAMDAAEAEAIPYYCAGGYVEPPLRYDPASKFKHAEANSARHIVDQTTTLTGAVILNQGSQEIRAPKIVQNELTQIAVVDGPLQIRDQGLLLTGDHAVSNMLTGEGTVDQSTFLLHESSFRGKAATLVRTPDNRLLLDDTSFTRCDPHSNTWSIYSEDLELKLEEGYGVAKKATIRIKDVPLIYTPYLRFPLNDKRYSGFLFPNIGHDSDGGTDIVIPYYLNLAPNYDATYQFRSMWKRGIIQDLQTRYMSQRTHNTLDIGYIHRDDEFDNRDIEDLTSDGVDPNIVIPPFEADNRWYLSLRHDGQWSPEWTSSINYNVTSDTEYAEDIGGDFGTDLDDFLNPVTSNFSNTRTASLDKFGDVEYSKGDFKASLALQAFQSLDPLGVDQYEKLPSLTADWKRDFGPVESKLKMNYTFFDKDNTNLVGVLATIGERAYTDVEVSWPYRKIWGFVKPSLGVIHRKYQLEDELAGVRANPEITTGRFSLDTGLYFDRFFTFKDQDLQQTLEPRLYYLYVEQDFQDDLPQFDGAASTPSFGSLFRPNRFSGFDRVGDADQMAIGLTSRFLDGNTGSELLSLSIGQIMYFADRDVVFLPAPSDDPIANESPLFAEARYKFGKHMSVNGTFEWEPDVNRSNRGSFSLTYNDKLRRILNINYRYTASEVQQPSLVQKSEETDINAIWPISNNWSFIGRWNFGWDDNRTIESLAGLEYNNCCWKTRLAWRRFLKEPRNVIQIVDDPNVPAGFITLADLETPSDVGIFFEFQLKGLGVVGDRLDKLLEDAIPGYREREDIIGL